MLQSSSLRSKELAKKKRNRRLVRLGVVVGGFVLIVGLLSYGAHRKEIRISAVELSGGVLVTQPEVQADAFSYLAGSYFWLFPKNNALLYSRTGLENHLRADFPRISEIVVSLKNFHTLLVTIRERTPQAHCCDMQPGNNSATSTDSTLTATPPHCYFMDSTSSIFAPAPDFSGDAYFKYYGLLDTSTSTPIGMQYIASSTEFAAINNFIESMRQMSLDPAYLSAQDNGDFTVALDNGAKIYFNISSVSDAATNLAALLRTPTISRGASHELLVDYIDLRFGNKLFYVPKKSE